MMDASLPADQSGLSDLSAASIVSTGPYLGPPSPPADQQTEVATVLPTPSPTFAASHSNATPGPSRIRTQQGDSSSAVWTPSPDASSSRSKSSSRSMQRPSSRNSIGKANESIGSSLGTFDYSNASFSESFLRQAGANMLAGLDEANPSPRQSLSFSPRYRTSSSPTVTARPIRGADPRTPFTGKSLRTRMAEAGMLDSPASSDGSSPSSSPTTRMLPDSVTRTIVSQLEHDQELSPQPGLDSPNAQAYLRTYSPSLDRLRHGNFASPSQQAAASSIDSVGMEEEHEWQEGLSMVPEESYIEDASRLPASPAGQNDAPHRSMVLDSSCDKSTQPAPKSDSPSSASDHVQLLRQDDDSSDPDALVEECKGHEDTNVPQASSSDNIAEESSDKSDSPSKAQPSPSPRKATPPTPSRMVNTPKSFARLRVGTPVRSSPLAREVNFSPSSAGSNASRWQSPVSQRSTREEVTASPHQVAQQSPVRSILEGAQSHTPAREVNSDEQRSIYEPATHPQTPHAAISAQPWKGTPSQFWSPATTASFATPASQRPQHPSAPTTPAIPPRTPFDAFSSPAADFGTPQWSPSPAPLQAKVEAVQIESEKPEADVSVDSPQDEGEEELASSSASVGSERKQSGDVSTASQRGPDGSRSSLHARAETKLDLSLTSPSPQHDSPSAARFSRLQLTRIPPPTTLPPDLASNPELGLVASAFDSLSQLSESRVSRLLSQLTASTARIEELEAALEAQESERAELHDVRTTLSQLSTQHEELVHEADEKDAAMVEMVRKLQGQLSARGGDRIAELERELEEERRLREVDRRDYEVRMQGLLASTTSSSPTNVATDEVAFEQDDQVKGAVEQAKEQLRLTLEKDFEVRRAMEQRELQARVEELERQLASTSNSEAAMDDNQDPDLQRQVDQLTSELDRRFEELADLREELESALTEKERVESRVLTLEEELDEARSHSHHSRGDSVNEELDELRTTLAERDSHIARLEETLSLTTSRLTTLGADHDALQHQNTLLGQSQTDSSARIAQLESHILSLETQLRTRTPTKPAESTAEDAPATPAHDRVAKLQQELATLQLDLVRLGKANDALQEDNVHFSIALSAKQLELGMVKRNARFALKNARAIAQGDGEGDRVGLPLSKSVQEKEKEFPEAPKGEVVERREVDKENVGVVPVNQARMQARQMLAMRKAARTAGGEGGGGGRRVRQMLAA